MTLIKFNILEFIIHHQYISFDRVNAMKNLKLKNFSAPLIEIKINKLNIDNNHLMS